MNHERARHTGSQAIEQRQEITTKTASVSSDDFTQAINFTQTIKGALKRLIRLLRGRQAESEPQ